MFEYFDDTTDGVRRKDGRRISAPPVTALPEIFSFGRHAAADREVPDDVDGEVVDDPALVDKGGWRGCGGRGCGQGRGGRGSGRGHGGRGHGGKGRGGRGCGGRGCGGREELVADAGESVADEAVDPLNLIPEVTDPAWRHDIAQAYALGLPPPPPPVE